MFKRCVLPLTRRALSTKINYIRIVDNKICTVSDPAAIEIIKIYETKLSDLENKNKELKSEYETMASDCAVFRWYAYFMTFGFIYVVCDRPKSKKH